MGLDTRSASTLLLGAFSIAVVHALIPSHWLAFAMVGRAKRWNVRRILSVTALAGTGHVAMTIVLGFCVTFAGKQALRAIPPVAEHAVMAVVLIGLGLFLALPATFGRHGCRHPHHHEYQLGREASGEQAEPQMPNDGPSVMAALVMGLTLSPCLDLLPVYVAAAALPWRLVAILAVIMAVTTVSLMSFMVLLTLRSLEMLKLEWLEHNESIATGGILVVLGILIFFF